MLVLEGDFMYSKKLLFLLVVFFSGMEPYLFPAIDVPIITLEKGQIVEGATYYKVHGSGHCAKHGVMGSTSCSPKDCLECLAGVMNGAETAVTYHNVDWDCIAIIDLSNSSDWEIDGPFCASLKQFLDPNAKPKAVRASIDFFILMGTTINFYDRNNKFLCDFVYSGGTVLSEKDRKRFESCLDLSELKAIENHVTILPSVLFAAVTVGCMAKEISSSIRPDSFWRRKS